MSQATYKKTQPEDMALRLKAQNLHIAKGYQACNDALLDLFQNDFTVVRVAIGETARPEIWVQQCRQCARLPSVVISTNNDVSGRYLIRQSVVQGCVVKWQERTH